MNIRTIIASLTVLFLFTACQAENPDSMKTMVDSSEIIAVADETTAVEKVEVLGSFTTKFTAYPKSRALNIGIASERINGIVIHPNEIFSFNEATGPTNKENGYKLAKIFVRGEEKEGYGGGVCQVSSTLLNAALDSDLEILERHAHTKKVHYVAEGYDAATSYGYKDFRFKNIYDYSIKINSIVEDGAITIAITAL